MTPGCGCLVARGPVLVGAAAGGRDVQPQVEGLRACPGLVPVRTVAASTRRIRACVCGGAFPRYSAASRRAASMLAARSFLSMGLSRKPLMPMLRARSALMSSE